MPGGMLSVPYMPEDAVSMPQEELDGFINLLQRIFVYEPERRASLEEILNHPWLQGLALPGVGAP